MNIAIITFPGANGLDCYNGLQDVIAAVGTKDEVGTKNELGTKAEVGTLEGQGLERAGAGNVKGDVSDVSGVRDVNVELVPHTTTELGMYDGVILPGGFSFGDYLRSGAIARHTPVVRALAEANEQGKLIVGIGNGFQILTEAGLLPGVLRKNAGQRFMCKSVQLEVVNEATAFTALYERGENIAMPIAHESGSYYCDDETLQALERAGRIVLRYVDNPNGSQGDIAAIVNERGNVLGMMPHPERAVNELLGSVDGVRLFTSIMNTWRERHGSAS